MVKYLKDIFPVDLLCVGCMSFDKSAGICKKCGFNENDYHILPHHLPLRTILNGKYLVGKVLGEGGFGITYLGWDLYLDLKIAIKEYYPAGFVTRENTYGNTVTPYAGEKNIFFQNGKEKFIEEAKRLAKFYTLAGIVLVKDFFLENGTAYIVMEYVEGETLKQYLQRTGGRVSANLLFELMKPLMESLMVIHKAGLIHRDISPDNIMLTKDGKVKLLDFGAARDFFDSGNRSISVMLKPGYAPEEQYRSRGVQGPWTDIYALCATMYKAITGVTPDESSERLRGDNLKSPSQLGIPLLPYQEAALMKGMAVLQEDRFQTVDDLYNALFGMQTDTSKLVNNTLAANENLTDTLSVNWVEAASIQSSPIMPLSADALDNAFYPVSDQMESKSLLYKASRVRLAKNDKSSTGLMVSCYIIAIISVLVGFLLSFMFYDGPYPFHEILYYMPFQTVFACILIYVICRKLKKRNIRLLSAFSHVFRSLLLIDVLFCIYAGYIIFDYLYLHKKMAYLRIYIDTQQPMPFLLHTLVIVLLSTLPFLFYFNIISFRLFRNRSNEAIPQLSKSIRRKIMLVYLIYVVICILAIRFGLQIYENDLSGKSLFAPM